MKIKAENICKEITTRVYVDTCQQYHPVLAQAVFECRSCMKLHKLEQPPLELREPAVCTECGGNTFKLLKEESEFTDIQELRCFVESRSITVYLRGCQCKSEGYAQGSYKVKGRLNVDITREPYTYYIDQVVDIRKNKS